MKGDQEKRVKGKERVIIWGSDRLKEQCEKEQK